MPYSGVIIIVRVFDNSVKINKDTFLQKSRVGQLSVVADKTFYQAESGFLSGEHQWTGLIFYLYVYVWYFQKLCFNSFIQFFFFGIF